MSLVTALLALAGLLGPVPTGHAVWPLDPRPEVVRRFDPPPSPWASGHRGVDLRASPGARVRAAEAGTVRFVGRIAGRGVVVLDHGGTRTTYEPVRASVRLGERVAAGAVIGRLELFGSHCFPAACLHWGLIEGRATYRDPLGLLGAPVRLLPLDSVPGPTGGTVEGSPTWRHAVEMPILVTPRRDWAGAGQVGGWVRRAGGPGGRPAAAGRW